MNDAINSMMAIPDGAKLRFFPAHGENGQCWCNPIVLDGPNGISTVLHKLPEDGEFNA